MTIRDVSRAVMALLSFTLIANAAQAAAKPEPGKGLLNPDNHMLILIDHQPQMAFATRSIDIAELRNNVTGLAKAAKAFSVPTILTTAGSKVVLGTTVSGTAGGVSRADAH